MTVQDEHSWQLPRCTSSLSLSSSLSSSTLSSLIWHHSQSGTYDDEDEFSLTDYTPSSPSSTCSTSPLLSAPSTVDLESYQSHDKCENSSFICGIRADDIVSGLDGTQPTEEGEMLERGESSAYGDYSESTCAPQAYRPSRTLDHTKKYSEDRSTHHLLSQMPARHRYDSPHDRLNLTPASDPTPPPRHRPLPPVDQSFLRFSTSTGFSSVPPSSVTTNSIPPPFRESETRPPVPRHVPLRPCPLPDTSFLHMSTTASTVSSFGDTLSSFCAPQVEEECRTPRRPVHSAPPLDEAFLVLANTRISLSDLSAASPSINNQNRTVYRKTGSRSGPQMSSAGITTIDEVSRLSTILDADDEATSASEAKTSGTKSTTGTFGQKMKPWSIDAPPGALSDKVHIDTEGQDLRQDQTAIHSDKITHRPRPSSFSSSSKTTTDTGLSTQRSYSGSKLSAERSLPDGRVDQKASSSAAMGRPNDAFLPTSPIKARRMSKVDQLLGDGAAAANQVMQRERKVLKEAYEKTIGPKTPPQPVRHGHKVSYSVPTYPLSPTRNGASPPTPSHHYAQSISSSRITRSNSLDSQRSLTDSINTLTHLTSPNRSHTPGATLRGDTFGKGIPFSPISDGHRMTSSGEMDIATRNDLSVEQRRVLLRSFRVLEKRLGEPLREDETGRLVVGTRSASPDTGLNPSGSKMARKAKAALGLERGKEKDTSVAENAVKSQVSPPLDHVSADNNDHVWVEEDGLTRAQRRRQIYKLNKMLGTVITPSQLAHQGEYSVAMGRAPLVDTSSPDTISYLDIDTAPSSPTKSGRRSNDSPSPTKDRSGWNNGSWTRKIRQTVHKRSYSTRNISTPPVIDLFQPPIADEPHLATEMYPYISSSSLTPNDAGSRDPTTNDLVDLHGSHTTSVPNDTFGAISQSLHGLLYLIDNDPNEFGRIVDELDDMTNTKNTTATHSNDEDATRRAAIPKSKPDLALDLVIPEPHSKEARRKRKGKLTQFFGETNVEFDVGNTHNPVLPPNHPLHHSTYKSKSAMRRETLDGMLGEMWRAIQSEGQKGGLEIDDVVEVGDLISTLKRRRDRLVGGGWERI